MYTILAILVFLAAGPSGAGSLLSDGPGPGAHASSAAVAQPDKPAEKKEPAKKDEPKQPEKKGEAPAPPPATPGDPPTEDILKDMEKQRGNPPPAPSPSAPAATGPTDQAKPAARAPSGRLLREGTFLVDRRGRMVRAANGDWTYTFDADAQGQSDPAMTLMPCQRLEAMEKLAERYGESMTLLVTGQVFAYRNRNYLLPSHFRVVRQSGDIKSTQ